MGYLLPMVDSDAKRKLRQRDSPDDTSQDSEYHSPFTSRLSGVTSTTHQGVTIPVISPRDVNTPRTTRIFLLM